MFILTHGQRSRLPGCCADFRASLPITQAKHPGNRSIAIRGSSKAYALSGRDGKDDFHPSLPPYL